LHNFGQIYNFQIIIIIISINIHKEINIIINKRKNYISNIKKGKKKS